MKKAIKWLLLFGILAVIIVGATLLYNNFKEEYAPALTEEEETIIAPDFTVFDMDGNAVRLSDFKGQPVVLNFWATWCFYCKQEMPDFDELAKKYPDVQFLMVNVTDGLQETEETARKYIKEKGYEFDVFFDLRNDAAITYGINSLPATYFINRDGEIVWGVGGMMGAKSLEEAIIKIK